MYNFTRIQDFNKFKKNQFQKYTKISLFTFRITRTNIVDIQFFIGTKRVLGTLSTRKIVPKTQKKYNNNNIL